MEVNGVWTYFYYAGSQRIEERDGNDNLHYDYLFEAPGSDRLLYRQDFTTNGVANFVWYLGDALGNTTHLLANNGAVIEQYTYDAYGTPSVYNGSGTLQSGSQYDNRYLFKSDGAYEWLAQAGLYYARARFYLPQHGRWLQPDPVGQKGGFNLYAYCGNDPVNKMDASGNEALQATDIVVKQKVSLENMPLDMQWAFNATGGATYNDRTQSYEATYTRTESVLTSINPNSGSGFQ